MSTDKKTKTITFEFISKAKCFKSFVVPDDYSIDAKKRMHTIYNQIHQEFGKPEDKYLINTTLGDDAFNLVQIETLFIETIIEDEDEDHFLSGKIVKLDKENGFTSYTPLWKRPGIIYGSPKSLGNRFYSED